MPPLRGWGLVIRFCVLLHKRRSMSQGLKPGWKCGLYTRRLSAALPRYCLRYEILSKRSKVPIGFVECWEELELPSWNSRCLGGWGFLERRWYGRA
jgi:hypothetical protein